MSKSKAVSITASNTVNKASITKPVAIEKDRKDVLLAISMGLPSVLSIGSLPFALIASDISILYGTAAMAFLAGAGTGILGYLSEKEGAINNAFTVNYRYQQIPLLSRMISIKKRVFINSFHIREKTGLDLKEWQDPKNAVAEYEATHTVHQYLRKTRMRTWVEQEITPNHEAVWDMSADALVEVYGIQEKAESMKGIAA